MFCRLVMVFGIGLMKLFFEIKLLMKVLEKYIFGLVFYGKYDIELY